MRRYVVAISCLMFAGIGVLAPSAVTASAEHTGYFSGNKSVYNRTGQEVNDWHLWLKGRVNVYEWSGRLW